MYTAIVLDSKSQNVLLERLLSLVDYSKYSDWKVFNHHLTIQFGGTAGTTPKDKAMVGKQFEIIVDSIGISDKCIAFGASNMKGISQNANPHITMIVNVKAGAKPFQSNEIKKWQPIVPVKITGNFSIEK